MRTPNPEPRTPNPKADIRLPTSVLLDRMVETIRRHEMLAGGETVLVAVSGGADSMVLLHALKTLAPEWSLSLHVLHIHHGIRPESDGEAAFVERVAGAWGLPVTVERLRGLSPESPSLEAEARSARYTAFRAWAERLGADRVALGHTGDDQAETVLMRLLQGAGPRGLSGIPPVRGRYIRPLIEVSRGEIESYCRSHALEWVEDPSNRDPKHFRNRVRHELLPLLASTENPKVREALRRVGRRAREVVESLAFLAEREFHRLAQAESDGVTLPLGELRQFPSGLLGELLRVAMSRLEFRDSLRESHYLALKRLIRSSRSWGELRLGEILVQRGPERVRLAKVTAGPVIPELALAVPGSLDLPAVGLRFEASVVQATPSYPLPNGNLSVAFDLDQLPDHLTVRGRRPGDRFTPFGAPGSKSLKRFLIDRRVPRWERAGVPLVLAGREIIWVVGLRRGDGHRVVPETRRILELRATPLGRRDRTVS
ncbi:MAG TPA: tRNA lysidine(34) synthetase TilS [Methylomirabilota bacterium]|nr:tRNA lysidine(34) synthetase TilS [Methylomirabilota bacterium]